jgi:(R)-2-hydroxyglutarate---pyruvate transhydrogenase
MDPDAGLVTTGVLAQSPTQFESLWAIREGVPEAVGKSGKTYKYDVSIPASKFKEIVDKTKEHLRSKGLLHENAAKVVLGYGHFGDGAGISSSRIPSPPCV